VIDLEAENDPEPDDSETELEADSDSEPDDSETELEADPDSEPDSEPDDSRTELDADPDSEDDSADSIVDSNSQVWVARLANLAGATSSGVVMDKMPLAVTEPAPVNSPPKVIVTTSVISTAISNTIKTDSEVISTVAPGEGASPLTRSSALVKLIGPILEELNVNSVHGPREPGTVKDHCGRPLSFRAPLSDGSVGVADEEEDSDEIEVEEVDKDES
jgi:hypothetical protein